MSPSAQIVCDCQAVWVNGLPEGGSGKWKSDLVFRFLCREPPPLLVHVLTQVFSSSGNMEGGSRPRVCPHPWKTAAPMKGERLSPSPVDGGCPTLGGWWQPRDQTISAHGTTIKAVTGASLPHGLSAAHPFLAWLSQVPLEATWHHVHVS